MGTFSVVVTIAPPGGQPAAEARMTVDTGATYSLLPSDLLTRLGVQVEELRPFEMADNRIVELPIGGLIYRYGGRQAHAPVVFGDPGVSPLLGATALEGLGLAVDPVRQRLIPVTALLK